MSRKKDDWAYWPVDKIAWYRDESLAEAMLAIWKVNDPANTKDWARASDEIQEKVCQILDGALGGENDPTESPLHQLIFCPSQRVRYEAWWVVRRMLRDAIAKALGAA